MNWKKFFAPNKQKILIAFFLTLFWFLVGVVGIIFKILESNVVFLSSLDYALITGLMIGQALFQMLWHYPLACYIAYLLNLKKSRKKVFTLNRGVVLVLLFLVFNPVFLNIAFFFTTFFISGTITGQDCFLIVSDVLPDSPAQKAGMVQGLKVLEINGKTVRNVQVVDDEFSQSSVGDTITIKVDGTKEYELVLAAHPETGKPYVGFELMGLCS